MKKTLGGDRLGSGKKMEVDLHGYSRSTHDMGYIWRSSMGVGTLVPFLCEVGLPGDTFDIHLDCDIKTHPTIGPLFGSFKVQLDLFEAPIRLYNSYLHNNRLGIGNHMRKIRLPQIKLEAAVIPDGIAAADIDNCQINPSCLLSYLGIRGVGFNPPGPGDVMREREFNAVPLLAYWEIYKNYYANKQEVNGWVVHTNPEPTTEIVDQIFINGEELAQAPTAQAPIWLGFPGTIRTIQVVCSSVPTEELLQNIKLNYTIDGASFVILDSLVVSALIAGNTITVEYRSNGRAVLNWDYINQNQPRNGTPRMQAFRLGQIDEMRDAILAWQNENLPYIVNESTLNPYELYNWVSGVNPALNSQEGLGIKTYQSDLFNNWLSTEWIDGTDGITATTAIDTSGGSFTLDTLNLSQKVYEMLNRIAVSGGSYDDWIDAVYAHDRYRKAESPMYHGGLIKELVFQEVVSNSQSGGAEGTGEQPLGTLAGRGVMAKKNKGGHAVIQVNEPSYIMGIISLTPRVDYSQGNKWDTQLKTMDDLHKPALDEIGFQELITEQMAWWDTRWDTTENEWVTKSAGKQPAWINYMTNVNQTRGNFAMIDNEMFMTLNRRYEYDVLQEDGIKDLTTYIDPAKYNFIFAETATDAQNFWAQIAVDITARRKMSAKIMPNI